MKISPALHPLILASASPRRKKILDRLGYDFRIIPSTVEESFLSGQAPEKNAERLAREKAMDVAKRLDQGTVIGCDTVVAVEKKVLGKPASAEDARMILSCLSGKTQRVISGLYLFHVRSGIEKCGHEETSVFTRPMSRHDIDEYIATGECYGKAGAYAIQETGDRFIDKVEGSMDNVVGFPSVLFENLLNELARSVGDGSMH